MSLVVSLVVSVLMSLGPVFTLYFMGEHITTQCGTTTEAEKDVKAPREDDGGLLNFTSSLIFGP